MKFGITFGRKIPLKPFHMVEVSLYTENDDGEISISDAYDSAKNQVDQWIREELESERRNERRITPVG